MTLVRPASWSPSVARAAAARGDVLRLPGRRRTTAPSRRTSTATVSIYKGSDVRVMGVRIGTVTAVVPEGDRVRVAMEYDARVQAPGRRQGGHRHADADRRPVRADRAGVHRWRGDAGQRQDRAARDRHPGRARPDLPEPLRPHPGARTQRRQQGRRARHPAHRRHQGAAGQRQARQRDAAQPLRGGADLRRQQRAAVRLGREHVAADRHPGGQRPARRRLHGRPDLGLHPARRRARQPAPRRWRRWPGRWAPCAPSCTTTRALVEQGRPAAQPRSSASWPSGRTS